MRTLSNSQLATLPASIARFGYARESLGVGIVHIGPGVFHRAHPAWFTEAALGQAADRTQQWGICVVAMHTENVVHALREQDHLYTLAVLDDEVRLQVVGAIVAALHAPTQLPAVLAELCAPTTKVVTLTITEKGYCLTRNGELNFAHPDIQHDLADPAHPISAVGLLALALAQRRAAGVAPFLAVSCDNLPDNGARLRRALLQFTASTAPEVSRWLEQDGRFINTLVDSIAPAVEAGLLAHVQSALGVRDAMAVQREPYTQWVLEDPGALPRPAWEVAGALWVPDVAPYEQAKLRVLNGSHSTLTYFGLLLGLNTMSDAMATPLLRAFIEPMLREEVVPGLARAPTLDHQRYVGEVLRRIGNPRLGHRLLQIGMDGSQKVPLRLLPCIVANLAAGRPSTRLSLAVCGWLCFIRDQGRRGIALSDPADAALRATGQACTGDAAQDISRFLALREVFDEGFAANPQIRAALIGAYTALGDASPARIADALGRCT